MQLHMKPKLPSQHASVKIITRINCPLPCRKLREDHSRLSNHCNRLAHLTKAATKKCEWLPNQNPWLHFISIGSCITCEPQSCCMNTLIAAHCNLPLEYSFLKTNGPKMTYTSCLLCSKPEEHEPLFYCTWHIGLCNSQTKTSALVNDLKKEPWGHIL